MSARKATGEARPPDGFTHILGRSVHGSTACGRMAREAVFVEVGETPTCPTCSAIRVRRAARGES